MAVVEEYRPSRLPICAFYKQTVLSSSEDSCDDDDQVNHEVIARLKKKINDYDPLCDSDCQTPQDRDSEKSDSSTVSNSRDSRGGRIRRRARSLPRLPTEENNENRGSRSTRRSTDDSDLVLYQNDNKTQELKGYKKSQVLVTKRFEQLSHMIQAPNGSGYNSQSTSSNQSSKNGQTSTIRTNGGRVFSGTQRLAGTSGGFGDDPDDPRKPRAPRKEPQDKIDDDSEKKKRKEQEKMLVKLSRSITIPPRVSSTASYDKLTQTNEGDIEALNKKIKLKDQEISAMQNLINLCRHDYEELQHSFDTYKGEFEEVDKNCAYILSLRKENELLKQENTRKHGQIYHLEEVNKKLKNKLSKQDIDFDFLRTEKLELLKQLRHYEQNHNDQQAEQKKQERQRQESAILELKKSSSLQEIKILRAQETNNVLTLKIEHFEGIVGKLNQAIEQSKIRIKLHEKKEEELKNTLVNLSSENSKFNSKCSQFAEFTSELSSDLQRIYDQTRDATKRLDNDMNEIKTTSSSLSTELAPAQNFSGNDTHDCQQNRVSMFIRLIPEALEELKNRIVKTKLKLDKMSTNYNETCKDHENTTLQMNKRLAALQEYVENQEAKCKTIEEALQDSQFKNEQLNETLDQVKNQLQRAYENYRQMLSSKDTQIDNLQSEFNSAISKQDKIQGEYQTVFHDNRELKTTLSSVKNASEKQLQNERELRGYIEELETETQRILGNLTRERRKSQDLQRSFEKAQSFLSSDLTEMQEDLQSKIRELGGLLDNFIQLTSNDPNLWNHPYTSTIDKGMQILYDITGLVNAIGQANAASRDSSAKKEEDERYQQLEAAIDLLEMENKQLQYGKQKLEKLAKTKKRVVTFAENTKGSDSSDNEELQLTIEHLQSQLKDKEVQLNELTKQLEMLQLENDTIEELLRESEQQATSDQDKLQTEIKQLQLKIVHDKDFGDAKINRLEELNKDLMQKIQLYANLLNKGQEDKEAFDPEIDVKVPVLQLQNAIKFLEKRISNLQEEKKDTERQMKTMFSTVDTDKELIKCHKERQDLDAKVQNKQTVRNSLEGVVESAMRRSEEMLEGLAERTALQDEVINYRQQSSKLNNGLEKEDELIQRNTEIQANEKITSLEAQLKCQTDSEQELFDKMCALEQTISLLEAEKLQHAKTITSMIRTLQAKEDLAKAIKARDETEKDFNQHLDEMEMIVASLKREKQNPQADEKVKAKYKAQYYESRDKVAKLNTTLQKRNELIDELRGFVKELRKEEQKMEAGELGDLKSHFDVLRSTLENKATTEYKLKKKLIALKEKIAQLEEQKQESDRIVETLSKSVNEKDRHEVEDLKSQLKELQGTVLKLTQEKQQLQKEILLSKKIIEETRGEIELQEKNSQENMENLEKSLKVLHNNENAELKQMLHKLNTKVQVLETDKSKTSQDMKILLNSLKCKDELESTLKEKQMTEKALSDKLCKLQENKDKALKSLQQQVNNLSKELEEKTTKLTELEGLNGLSENLQQKITSLTEQLSANEEKKKTIIKEHQTFVEKIFKEMDKKTFRIKSLEDDFNKLRTLTKTLKETLTAKHEQWTKAIQERDKSLEEETKNNQILTENLGETEQKVANLSQEIFFLCKHNRDLEEETRHLKQYVCNLEETRRNDQHDLTQRIRELVAESKIDNEKIETLERDIMIRVEMQTRLEGELQNMKAEVHHEKTRKVEIEQLLEFNKQRIVELEKETLELKASEVKALEMIKTNTASLNAGGSVQERAKKAILDSLDDSEKTLEKIRSNWKHINSLQLKGLTCTQNDSKSSETE